MKPIYLEFCGINSFSEKTQIDFRALLAGGVFGIFGDTGSGKSTILDCIHLALYGVIERASKSMNDCINYKSDSAYVIFDFELTMDGKRRAYRVHRERKRKNGTAKAYLYEYTENGERMALAEGTRDVDEQLERIIGLSFSDFKMCIALPQGDFAALVKSTTAERVKLVSRLFDLEKYGDKLWKSASEKFYQAEQEVALIKAEMGQNEGGRDEFIAEKCAQIQEEAARLQQADGQLKSAETAYEIANALHKEKTQYDEVCRVLEEMRAMLPVMEEKRALAERAPLAKAVVREGQALEKNALQTQTAEKQAKLAQENAEKALLLLNTANQQQAESGVEDKILQATLALEKVRGAEADLLAEKEAENKYNACKEEYRKCQKELSDLDFPALFAEKEKALAALGEDDNFLQFVERHCKDAFLAQTYQEVQADLQTLAEKYPQTQSDVDVLLKKYTPNATAGSCEMDTAALQTAFKEIEQQRKQLRLELQALENQQISNNAKKERMQNLAEQGRAYHELLNEWQKKNAEIAKLGSLSDLQTKYEQLQAQKRKLQANIDSAQDNLNKYRAEIEKQKALFLRGEEDGKLLQTALAEALKNGGFDSVDEAQALLQKVRDEETARKECKIFFEKYELYRHKYEETDRDKFINYDANSLLIAQENKKLAKENYDEINRKLASYETELVRLKELKEKYQAFEKVLKEKEKARDLCDELRVLLRNNRFLEYIASEYLQEICVSAGKTLLSLTGGRYFLKYDKEFKVGDNLDGGNLRAVKTLSGGETFLVSLSLALSLSAAICQKSLRPIEFFFLDEGFGTLDEKLVDTVMDVLGKLSKSFSVGLISHVEELKHRIDNKLLVTGANEKHGSQVRVERF